MSWSAALLHAVPGTPLAFAMLAFVPSLRDRLSGWLPFAPVPALAAALLLPGGIAEPFPRVLLGAGLSLEDANRVFLGAAALLWMLAGIAAVATIRGTARGRFAGFWLVTLAGNMLLFVAADVVTFYVAFAMLSFAAYGLIVHSGTAEAQRAGRVYIVLTVLGETCLLLAFLLGTHAADSILIEDVRSALVNSPGTERDLAVGLMVAGFGVKAGLIPLHVWLPLAHPAAPVAASAVLSGALVKAGIFGFVRLLPLEASLAGWSEVLLVSGLLTAYLGAALGVVQHRPKTVLAYSTMSQMGLLVAVLGSAAGSSNSAAAVGVVAFYALHHGYAKGALFLSVGAIEGSGARGRAFLLAASALAAAAIAGAPLTGGALAKLAIKTTVMEGVIELLIALSAVPTTLLMLRFLQLVRRGRSATGSARAGLMLAFLGCTAAAIALPWVLLPDLTGIGRGYALEPGHLWSALWPILVAIAMMAAVLSIPSRFAPRVPEGDLIVIIEACVERSRSIRVPRVWTRPVLRRYETPRVLDRLELMLARWPAAGAILLTLALLIFGHAALIATRS